MGKLDPPQNEVQASLAAGEQIVTPVFAEELKVTKQNRETGRVRISTVTHQHEEMVDELLAREQVEVERIAIGKPIDSVPPVREEGDTVVISIVEEVLVVERRLMLKEELRLRRVRSSERYQERVTLRRQEAVVSRIPTEPQQGQTSSDSTDR
jgi:stress response protein YsnF